MNTLIVETNTLTKRYDTQTAVHAINLRVPTNAIFALIGPNGAGKTTTVKMLTTLLTPTEGGATIAGYDLRRQAKQVRSKIGYVPQEAQADEALTGREHLILQGRLYGVENGTLNRRIEELLALVGLEQDANKRALEYSGGMRKLLDFAVGLIHTPTLLFLDEPTSGVDVAYRQRMLDYIRTLPAQGVSVFLTTHFLEEVEQLAQHVALINHGHIVAEGTPTTLKADVGQAVVQIGLQGITASDVNRVATQCRDLPTIKQVTVYPQRVTLYGDGTNDLLLLLKQRLDEQGIAPTTLTVGAPTLDDVFMYHVSAPTS